MLFNSFSFWIVFPCIFLIYWVIPRKLVNFRKWFLIIVSYLLYMNWKPAFALILLGVTIVTYTGALVIERYHTYAKIRYIIFTFVFLTLLPLIVFKYYNFINDSITSVLTLCGLHWSFQGLNWALPIGISFFSFQAVGYLLDVYYKRIEVEKSFGDYMLFVSFFPQIASGPISKASELLPQIKREHVFSYLQAREGLKVLLWGMFMKVVIADRLGIYVDTVYDNYIHYSGATCLIASIFYSIQIYCDFAGYSLMAVGLGKTLGFDLVNNFNRPYFSVSVTDFWRRWHISLSRWLKDYIYIPLGGSRCSKLRNYWNIFVTFLVSGIWHGANWTFIVWGLFHGVMQIIEKFLGLQKFNGKLIEKVVRIVITFFLVNFAWIFFRMPTIVDASNIIGRIFTDFGGVVYTASNTDLLLYILGISILLFKEIKEEFFNNNLILMRNIIPRWCVYVLLFFALITIGVLDSSQFIYISF